MANCYFKLCTINKPGMVLTVYCNQLLKVLNILQMLLVLTLLNVLWPRELLLLYKPLKEMNFLLVELAN